MGVEDLMAALTGGAPGGAVVIGGGNKDRPSTLSRAVQAMRLREYQQRYSAPNPFTEGDLVTVRAEAPYKGHGEVFIVVDTFPPMRRFDGPPTSDDYSRRFTMRVARLMAGGAVRGDGILGFAAHHADYEALPDTDEAHGAP